MIQARIFIKRSACALVLIWISLTAGLAQEQEALQRIWSKSLPFITNYTTDVDYKADLQNWCIEQDGQGIIYVANNSGVLEFDGSSWKLIKTPKKTAVRSLCKDGNGRIYVGAVNEIGYLVPDAGEGTKFHSLLPHNDVPASFGDAWFSYSINNAVYFICNNHIFRYLGNEFKVWEGDFGFAWKVNETLFVSERGQGLMKIDGDALRPVKGGAIFKGKGLMALLPYQQQQLLAIGLDKEVTVFDENGLRPLKKNGAIVRTRDAVYSSIRLSNGDYAFGTTGSGLYIMDRDGNIRLNISRRTGLTSDAVYAVFEDAEGDVWCATDNGLCRIELESPLRIVNEKHGLDENTFDLEYFNNSIYIGTSKGLFQLSENTSDATSPELSLKKISGIDNLTQDCHVAREHLVVANYDGIFTIDKRNQTRCIYQGYTTWLETPSLPDQVHLLFETVEDGVKELTYDRGTWRPGKQKLTIGGRAYSMVRSRDGNVLINTTRNGIFEIQWKDPGHHTLADDHSIVHLDTTRGLSSMNVKSLARVGNTIYASTDKGMHQYHDATHTFERTPGIMRYLRPYKGAWINEIAAANGDHFWICVYHDYESHLFKFTGNLGEFPASGRFSNVLVTKIYDSNRGIVLFGSNKSLILYNENKPSRFANNFKTMIRAVTLDRDSTIYVGGSAQAPATEVPFDHNSIHFRFSLPSYDMSSQNQFQYLLDGFDSGWSSWAARPQVSFTNLPEGNYTFRVRGRNVYGQLGEEDHYTFTILPPWYRTWWSYSLYVITLVAAVVMIVQWRSRELKREKIALEKIIRERTEKISQQAEQLKEMDHLKSSFFANISHEFRTPLTLILAPLENELKKSTSHEERETLTLMKRNAMRLLQLVNQLLDLSKLEAGKMMLHIRKGDLKQLLSVIVASFDSYADAKGIEFTSEITITKVCWYDPDKIEKIVTNLMSNALKYTPQGGRVSITVREKGMHAIINVADTGPGIPEDERHNLFSPFYQTRQIAAGQHQGTGLGLSLVKELVKLYNGSISFTSVAGQGTTFSVMLPITREAFTADQIIEDEADDPFHRERISGLGLPEDGDPDLVSEGLSEGGSAVLIAEDNPDMCRFMATILQKSGFLVTTAANGEEALQHAFSSIPSLVLTDLMMPGTDGIELTNRLKTDERTSHIPVILLTAKDEPQTRLEGLQSGADDYLTKPFSPEELLVRIHNLIEQRKMLSAKFRERIIIPPAASEALSLDEKFLHKVYTIIDDNLADYTFSVEKLAEESNMSRAQLLRKLKALTGLSPNDFIKDVRLKRAADMIRQKVSTISQIAYAVGFNDQSYFSKCFKKQFGQSPSDYALTVQEESKG